MPLPHTDLCPEPLFPTPPPPAPCHAPGQRWKALSEAEKAKYKVGLTPLPTSGRGGMQAWAPTSSLCLPAAPTATAVPGRFHPPLPATSAPPPTLAAQSVAPAAPPVAPPPSSSEARVQIQRVQTQTDGSASLPDSLPTQRSISLSKAPKASLPPGPPSSSTGQSVAEQELTRSSAVDDSGVVTMAPDPMAR